MNVLILTPDAVGSTLLQRLITIYMQFHNYDRPVINLHELTNGLVKYYNPTFNQQVLGKKDGQWGYHQTLLEISELLKSTHHYKTSRLAHYHIKNRQDTIKDQLSFYEYLNENFLIISCRRHNVFEHALSWTLSKITKKLNVYSPEEKINSFIHLYQDGIIIDPTSLLQTLDAYKSYLEWCNNHFSISSYFYYEEHLPNIERFIMNLPLSRGQPLKLSWHNNFGIDFNTWNKCHYLSSDIGSMALTNQKDLVKLANSVTLPSKDKNQLVLFLSNYRKIADPSWPGINSISDYNNLPEIIRNECEITFGLTPPNNSTAVAANTTNITLPVDHVNFLNQHTDLYKSTCNTIDNMVSQGTMVGPPPIKKQTMQEKKFLIKNFNQLLDIYNQWIIHNPEIGNLIDESIIEKFIGIEQQYWSPTDKTSLIT
jgi:hypothetical protein